MRISIAVHAALVVLCVTVVVCGACLAFSTWNPAALGLGFILGGVAVLILGALLDPAGPPPRGLVGGTHLGHPSVAQSWNDAAVGDLRRATDAKTRLGRSRLLRWLLGGLAAIGIGILLLSL